MPNEILTMASLPNGAALGPNGGRNYLPVSQFDQDQYSDFRIAGEATVFTMIARGAIPIALPIR